MQIVETHIVGKHPDSRRCEDRIVVREQLVAVIDGATDKSGRSVPVAGGTVTTGRFAADVCAAVLETIEPGVAPRDAVRMLSEALDVAIRSTLGDVADEERPGAAVAVYDAVAGVVWVVGDCKVRVDGSEHDTSKRIDEVTSAFRSAYLAAVRADGSAVAPGDPGREVILPLLRIQGRFANTEGEWGYSVINGRPVPASLVTVVSAADAREVVLATDGYPTLPGTLEEAEAELQARLLADPECIGVLRGTKGVQPGAVSFDDRAWVRVQR
jgi:glycerophosphoryl diester phosphodiesterase